MLKLTSVGECNSPRDVGISNDSLYYSTSVDIACDLLSTHTYTSLPADTWLTSQSTVMALPLYLLLGLIGVNRKQKAGLTALFCLGFFIIAVAIVRVFQTRATKNHHVDPTRLALWSQIEASVGKPPS